MYFYLIKMTTIGFTIITVLSIPAFYAYYNGGYLAEEETTSALDLTTLANLESVSSEDSSIWAGGEKDLYLPIYADLVYTIFFFFGLIYFKFKSAAEAKKIEERVITSSDYAVYLTGFPSHGSVHKREIQEFLEKNYG